MQNIKAFDTCTTYIFKELYSSFPICMDVDTYDALKDDFIGRIDMEQKQKELIFSETMYWLSETGFIRFLQPQNRHKTRQSHPLFLCTVLTEKGLSLLKSKPQSIDDKTSVGEEIVKAFKDGIGSKAAELATNAIINYATKG